MNRFFFALALLAATPLFSQEKKEAPAELKPHKPAMREVAPGVYEIGTMRLDKKAGTVSFPAKVNQDSKALEYLIITPDGATHESLFVTEVKPTDLHFAMLLLGVKGAGLGTPDPKNPPPGQIDAEYLKRAPKLKGDSIIITAKWKDKAGKEHAAQVEDWVMNIRTTKAAERGPWIYSGSMFTKEGVFLAEDYRLHASLVTNPAALINNPRKSSDDDMAWEVNTAAVPPKDTPVELVIKLEPAKTEAK